MASITYNSTAEQDAAVTWKVQQLSQQEGREITPAQYFRNRTDHWVNAIVEEYQRDNPPESRDVLWTRASTEDKAAIDVILDKYRV